MSTCATFVATCAALLLGLGAGPGHAQDGDNACSRFRGMSPHQREEFARNLQRWRDMSEGERRLVRSRFERLRDLEKRVEEADQLRTLREDERQKELRSKTRDWLVERTENLAPEERDAYRERLEKMTPEERARHFHEMVDREIQRRIERNVDAWMAADRLTPEEATGLRRMLDLSGPARFRELREWMLKRPDLFKLPPQAVEQLRNTDDPFFAMRLLRKMGCHGGRRRGSSGERLESYLKEHGVPDATIKKIRETRSESERRKLLQEFEGTVPWPPPFFDGERGSSSDSERRRGERDPARRPEAEAPRDSNGPCDQDRNRESDRPG